MDEELACLSTEELIEVISNYQREFPSISTGCILAQLVQRALHALQDQKDGHPANEAVEPELSALYGDCCYAGLARLLRSASISVRALAGATYLLALLTAGESKYANDFRSKVVKGCGVLRLVALLSAQSPSVRFNALLALGNLLRHCPNIHSEFLRLGALRKLAVLFKEACEEPQKNVCVDAFLCLCDSEVSGMCEELLRAGFVVQLLKWISEGTSTRVALKAVESISTLLDKGPARSAILELNLVQPSISLLKFSDSKELHMVTLALLEGVCCSEEGMTQCGYFVENDGVKTLAHMIQPGQNKYLMLQVIQLLAVLAVLDMKVREEISGMDSCLQFLQGLLRFHSETKGGRVLQNREATYDFELLPLQDEHVAAIRLLCKVCHNKFSTGKELLFCAPFVIAASGRMAARVGAE